MERLIFPGNLKGHVTAFFTGKDPGSDLDSVSRILNVRREEIYLPIQKHTDTIVLPDPLREPKIADAVVIKEKGLLIGVRVADCVPILLYGKGVAGAVHAGWRGTAEGILSKTLRLFIERFSCLPSDIQIAIGPSIKGCCYAVDHEVTDAVVRATGEGDCFIKKGDKYFLDLPSANRLQAIAAGIPESNIWVSGECTCCLPDRFFSYRFAKGTTGRQAAFIGMFPFHC